MANEKPFTLYAIVNKEADYLFFHTLSTTRTASIKKYEESTARHPINDDKFVMAKVTCHAKIIE